MKFSRILTLAIASTMMAPQLASAHVGIGDAHDALHGFIHPLTGIDHILAMVSVGLLAANLGGRAIWAVPASFVLMMVLGGIIVSIRCVPRLSSDLTSGGVLPVPGQEVVETALWQVCDTV